MIAGDLIRQAQASGIELRLVGGKVKAIGPREAVVRLIEPLRQHREALTHALQFELPEVLPATPPAGATPEPTDWHALDAVYLAHHFNCPTCIAAGRGDRYGLRCGIGATLWRAYVRPINPAPRNVISRETRIDHGKTQANRIHPRPRHPPAH